MTKLSMKSTPELAFNESKLEAILKSYPVISPLLKAIRNASGTAYLVGGAVRDLLLEREVHDLDIEVHGLSLDELRAIMAQQGTVILVGKSFGVLKLEGTNADWSLPRTDRAGRKPEVTLDPTMGIQEALQRRDLTMNSMAIDLHTYELVDPFGGCADLSKRILRSPDVDFFTEDPLRFYRVMQFIGRFEMEPDELLNETCRTMNISQVSVERIELEFEKLLLQSKRPSLGIRWLRMIGRLPEILPELAVTEEVMQEPDWHPEGNVFEHLMQTLDAAARIDKGSDMNNLIVRYAALCHDLGKTTTSVVIDGRIKSPGHAEEGVGITQQLLKRITQKVKLIETVKLLVKYHMVPGQLVAQQSSLAAYRRLALKLSKYTNLAMLASLSLADKQGRNWASSEPLSELPPFIEKFLQRAQEARVLTKAEQPILTGKDISDLVAPGPEMGKLLRFAFELQIEESITSKELLRERIIEYIKSH